uniref:Uncharacterized protein n=1 Tax=Ditylenchus dipsaci TaxID=166011 RepID=A0A915DXK2_9BILA
MNKAFFACLKCMKPRHSEEEYQQFCESIRDLLLTDEFVDKKKLVEEFALVDSSYYLFTMITEGIANFRSTKSLKNPLFFAAMKTLCCILNNEFQRRLEKQLKRNISWRLRDIYKDDMPLIFKGATHLFKQDREAGKRNKKASTKRISAEEVNIALSVFCVYIALGTHDGNQLEESNLSSISVCLDDLFSLDPNLMTDEQFKSLCSSFHDLLAQAVYERLKSSISQILNSLKEFQGDDATRQALIKVSDGSRNDLDLKMDEK